MEIQRTVKHLLTTDGHVWRLFPGNTLAAVERAFMDSDVALDGEVRIVIEGALEVQDILRRQSARERAIEFFSQLRVWDTPYNNGLLIYLLLAGRNEHHPIQFGALRSGAYGQWHLWRWPPFEPIPELENIMKTSARQASARAPDAKARSPKTGGQPVRLLSVVPKARAPLKHSDLKALDKHKADSSTEFKTPSPQELLEYQRDFFERSILFWDTLRKRANNMLELERAGLPPLLDFKYETLLDARSFEHPANYALLRITKVGEDCWDTQSRIFFERRTDLTRAGIGQAALALTCRSDSGVPEHRPALRL